MQPVKNFEVVDFHGRSCPGLALVYRVALAVLREIGQEKTSEDQEPVAIAVNDSCPVDAIQVFTGWTFGKGNLTPVDCGKWASAFIERRFDKSVRVSLDFTPTAKENILRWQA